MKKSATFVTGNMNKLQEVRHILGFEIGHVSLDLPEIQSMSPEEIVEIKAKAAYAECGTPVVVEDSGIFVDAWNGFPGPFAKYLFDVVGNGGFLKMLSGEENRKAHTFCVIGYYDGEVFEIVRGDCHGYIADVIRDGEISWGYDPVFVADGYNKSFAEMSYEERNAVSHRRVAWEKMKVILAP